MTDSTENRLEVLEIKSSYCDDLLEELNMALFRQQQQIERLNEQIRQLKEQAVRQAPGSHDGASPDPRDELPPHY